MNFINPNPQLAQAMVDSMSAHIESGHMLAVTVEDIMADFNSWFASVGLDEKLAGFFCIRTPAPNFTEIGSVRSMVKGGLSKIIKEFETQRKTKFGCAITKDHPEKFINLTSGGLIKPFPNWYQRDLTDKHFVQWE